MFFVILAHVTTFAAFSQTLPAGAQAPKADGMMVTGEYPIVKEGSNMSLGVALSSDGKTLYLALEAQTAGWVAIGVGSLKMNGAFMVLAFDADGKATVSEQTGKGHSHSPNDNSILVSSAVKEIDGSTTLEIALPAAGFAGGSSIQFITAYGKADNLKSFHRAHMSVEVPINGAS